MSLFDKILVANRGGKGRAATFAAKPERRMRAAFAGDLAAVETLHV